MIQIATNVFIDWMCHVLIVRLNERLMDSWWWCVEDNRWLMINDVRAMNHDGRSVNNYSWSSDDHIWTMYNKISAMDDLWRLMVNNVRSTNNDSVSLVSFIFGCLWNL